MKTPNFATISENPEIVPVAEFRDRIKHLERIIHVDACACVDGVELGRCRRIAQRIGAELIASTSKRAKLEDWERRERVIERSTAFVNSWTARDEKTRKLTRQLNAPHLRLVK